MSDEILNDQGKDIADSIADHIRNSSPGAIVQVNPTAIPAQIAGNLLVFLQRVRSEGMEAIAWVEAYQYVQQFAQQAPAQGVPFSGLSAKKA